MSRSGQVLLVVAAVVLSGVASPRTAQAQTPARPRVAQVSAKTSNAADDTTKPPVAPKSAAAEVLITRETYAYPGAGRRDPFLSLMNTEELRPLLTDLKLVAIAFDPTGRNSVAVLRDVTTKEQYRVKVAQVIGRMRVASIREKTVVFGIEEFGYSRQESLGMSDSTKVRTQ